MSFVSSIVDILLSFEFALFKISIFNGLICGDVTLNPFKFVPKKVYSDFMTKSVIVSSKLAGLFRVCNKKKMENRCDHLW